jgi:hypothetical protein
MRSRIWAGAVLAVTLVVASDGAEEGKKPGFFESLFKRVRRTE